MEEASGNYLSFVTLIKLEEDIGLVSQMPACLKPTHASNLGGAGA